MSIDTSKGLGYPRPRTGAGSNSEVMLIIEFNESVSEQKLHQIRDVLEGLSDTRLTFQMRAAPPAIGKDEVWLTVSGGSKASYEAIREGVSGVEGFVSMEPDFSGVPERATLVYSSS